MREPAAHRLILEAIEKLESLEGRTDLGFLRQCQDDGEKKAREDFAFGLRIYLDSWVLPQLRAAYLKSAPKAHAEAAREKWRSKQ